MVKLYVKLHSYLYFLHLEKLFWKASSTLPRHLINTLLFVKLLKHFFLTQSRHLLDTWWIDRESSCLPDSSSTPSGSIKLLFLNLILCFSIPSRYLSCRRPVPRDTSAVKHYWRVYILLNRDSSLISSICLWLFISQTLSFSFQTSSSRILQASSSLSLLGKLLILSHSCISWFKT